MPCVGISFCGGEVALAPCIGFLFSNKPSFIVVILTIVPSHLDFLCSSNQAQMELERKLGKANWFLGCSQVDFCAGSRILELILLASVLLWGYTFSSPWCRQLASISAWSSLTLGSEGARVLCMHPLKLALYIQNSMKGLAKVRRPHRLPGMMMASSSVTCWRAADSLYFCNKRP